MASAGIVFAAHQVVKLAFGMASSNKVHTVPEDSTLQAAAESTHSLSAKPIRQPQKDGAKKPKAPSRKVSLPEPQPSAPEADKSVVKRKHRRTNSSPLRTSTGQMSVHSAPVSPVVQTQKISVKKSSTPKPTTRGAHLRRAAPKFKRGSSFSGTNNNKVDVGDAPQEKEAVPRVSPTGQARKDGTKTAAKKKKAMVQQTTKRLSASTSKLRAVKDLESSGAGNDMVEKSTKRMSASTSKLNPGKDLDSPDAGKSRPSLSTTKQKQGTTAKGKGKTSLESPTTCKPKLATKQVRKTQSTQHTTTSLRSKSVVINSTAESAATSISPKSHSHDKLQSISKQVAAPGRLSSISDIPMFPMRDSSEASHDIVMRLESQRLLDEGHFYNPNAVDGPPQRKSETSVAYTSTPELSSTIHGSTISASKAAGNGKRSSLESSTTHLSTFAPADLYADTTVKPRPSSQTARLNQSERIGHERRRAQDDASATRPKHHAKAAKATSLTFFGNPLVPIDIAGASQKRSKLNLMHHKDALQVLGEIKLMKRQQLKVKMETLNSSTTGIPTSQKLHTGEESSQRKQPELKVIQLLKTAGTSTAATLSMTGFKGGSLEDQVNHDRSLIVSPFFLRNHSNSMVRRRLMGVFDGHAEQGSKFAEHCQQLLPRLLSRKLSEAFKKAVEDISAGLKIGEDEVSITKRVLMESFVIMDESSPREDSGGCTATVVYQQGQKVYIANTGDSRSFIAVYRKSQPNHHVLGSPKEKGSPKQSKPAKSTTDAFGPKHAKVVYISREDKPDLPGERKRLEGWGGEIIPAEKNKSSKVKFHNSRPGKASATLSMSRSIGDWQFTPLGVIPDPVVDVLDLKELVEKEKKAALPNELFIDDVCIFAVSASDGMMIEGVEEAEAVASELATSLFSDEGQYPLCACQSIITKTAAVWDRRNKGKFRDDITLAVTVLRTPATPV